MKIVTPYAKLLTGTPQALAHIEWCSRISHRSEDAQTKDSWKRFIETVVFGHGDWSVVEHSVASVDALVDRGITHEWVRHRLFSFTQESTRFVNYEKKMPPSFIYPQPSVSCGMCLSGEQPEHDEGFWYHDSTSNEEQPLCLYDPIWLSGIDEAEKHYRHLLNHGWRPQEARSVLPNALASRIVVTGNLRNWRHFFIMRTTQETHPQFRQVTVPLLTEFQTFFPVLFDDIVPMQKQSEAIKKAR